MSLTWKVLNISAKIDIIIKTTTEMGYFAKRHHPINEVTAKDKGHCHVHCTVYLLLQVRLTADKHFTI